MPKSRPTARAARSFAAVVTVLCGLAPSAGCTSNPGMGDQGLYYYYHTFAKALDAMQQDEIVDDEGKTHNWRAELVAELASRQQPDGSWVNSTPRWLESDPNLVTGYALLALSYCRPDSK